jgi:type IV pilus assembly protein PilA
VKNAGPLTIVRGLCFWHQGGFSALELVLVIAATSIIAALGVSMYRTHSVRAEIATTLDEASTAQRLIVTAFRRTGMSPRDFEATGIDATARPLLMGTYLDSVEVHNGRVDLHFGERADRAIAGKTLSLTPFETAGREVVWICGNEIPGVGLSPLGFAAGGPQAVQVVTPIEARYLPPACR